MKPPTAHFEGDLWRFGFGFSSSRDWRDLSLGAYLKCNFSRSCVKDSDPIGPAYTHHILGLRLLWWSASISVLI